MKKLNIIGALILVGIIRLFGQNYQTFYSNRIALFQNQNGLIKSIRIDSVKYLEDSILFPFNNIQEIGFGCYSPYAPSWIGSTIVIQDNEYNLFFNKNNDTIKIKIDAKLNESWLAYQLNNSIKIYAEVINYDKVTFLSLTDSVKTIAFQAYNKDFETINHEVNSKLIMISKNYGIIKIFDFYMFPAFEEYQYDDCIECDLIGLTNPELGIQNLTWKDVYNFNVEDEIHILYESHYWGTAEGYETITKKIIKKYLQKEIKGDSIIYNVDYKRSNTINLNGVYSYDYFHDTIISIIKSDSIFDRLPGEPIYEEYGAFEYYMFKDESGRRSKDKQSEHEWIVGSIGDSCWDYNISDGCFPQYSYIEGLGGPYYWCENWWTPGEEENSLVYYKKGESIWGTPLVITNLSESIIDAEFRIYPNPAGEIFFINTTIKNLPYLIELYDLTGKILIRRNVQKELFSFDAEQYNKGIYFFKITDKNNYIQTSKIIIK
jgi:hypothetical protein